MTKRTLGALTNFLKQLDLAHDEMKRAPAGLACNKCGEQLNPDALISYKYASGKKMLKGVCGSCKKQATVPDTRALSKVDPDPLIRQGVEEYLQSMRAKNGYEKKVTKPKADKQNLDITELIEPSKSVEPIEYDQVEEESVELDIAKLIAGSDTEISDDEDEDESDEEV